MSLVLEAARAIACFVSERSGQTHLRTWLPAAVVARLARSTACATSSGSSRVSSFARVHELYRSAFSYLAAIFTGGRGRLDRARDPTGGSTRELQAGTQPRSDVRAT